MINTADDISMLACMWWHSTGRERGRERKVKYSFISIIAVERKKFWTLLNTINITFSFSFIIKFQRKREKVINRRYGCGNGEDIKSYSFISIENQRWIVPITILLSFSLSLFSFFSCCLIRQMIFITIHSSYPIASRQRWATLPSYSPTYIFILFYARTIKKNLKCLSYSYYCYKSSLFSFHRHRRTHRRTHIRFFFAVK